MRFIDINVTHSGHIFRISLFINGNIKWKHYVSDTQTVCPLHVHKIRKIAFQKTLSNSRWGCDTSLLLIFLFILFNIWTLCKQIKIFFFRGFFFICVYICLFVMDIHCNSKWIQSHADNLLFKWIMQFSCWFVGQKTNVWVENSEIIKSNTLKRALMPHS